MSIQQVSKPSVTVLGLGAIGRRVAEVLSDAGWQVTVWNRTPARAAALAGRATVASSAAQAAAASPLVLLCVSSFDAVFEVLGDIAAAARGHTLVTLTTGTPDDARQTAARCERAQISYLDAGVQAQPEGIGTPSATFLFSGAHATFEQHRSTLERLGTARHVGEQADAAAVHDLTLFGLWYDAQLALLRAFETARRAGIDLAELAPLAATPLRYVLDGVDSTAREVIAGSFPRGPADLTEHTAVLDRLLQLRSGLRLGDADLARIAQLLRARIGQGHERDGFNSLLADDSPERDAAT